MPSSLPRLLPTLLLLTSLVAACSTKSRKPSPAAADTPAVAPDSLTIRQTAQSFRVQYQPPVPIDSSQYVYQPIMVVQLPSNRPLINMKGGLSTSSRSTSNYDSARGPVFNLLFYHLPTGRTHLLFPSGDYRIEQVEANVHPVRQWPYIFYQVIPNDRDQNGELTAADGRVLFVSDKAGENLHQLTPDSARLERWQLVPGTTMLLAELRYDSDHDGQFTIADSNYWLRCDLRAPQTPPLPFAPDSLSTEVQLQMLRRQSRLQAPQ